ncbi:MAG: Rrf2 family transcriptional regulator [Armatimonadetes bacterium]|nr:Rrf2 family transcriptional regulator [Armatimonadota bacterium]
MRVSTRTRYGVRAMMELAIHDGPEPVSVRQIAEAQELPVKYLEQLIAALRAAELVRSQRGIGGGYLLTRRPEEITVADIYEALEGPLVPVECLSDSVECSREDICATRDVWSRVTDAVREVLTATTLADLVADTRAKCAIGRPDSSEDSAAL